MNNTFLIAIGLLLIASLSVVIANITSAPTIIIYLVGLVIWLIGIQMSNQSNIQKSTENTKIMFTYYTIRV